MTTDLVVRVQPVSKAIYFACSRPRRKEIALRLAEWRQIRTYAEMEAQHLLDNHQQLMVTLSNLGVLTPTMMGYIRGVFSEKIKPLLELALQPTPRRLLACGLCGYDTPNCICVDSNGHRLDWGLT